MRASSLRQPTPLCASLTPGGDVSANFGLNRWLNQLDPVAKGIVHKNSRAPLQRFILPGGMAGFRQRFDQARQAFHDKSRMRLFGGPEIELHPEVELNGSVLEPTAATLGEICRFCLLGDAEQPRIKRARLGL